MCAHACMNACMHGLQSAVPVVVLFLTQVNVLAPFLLTDALLDLVARAERGKIIIVSSISQVPAPCVVNACRVSSVGFVRAPP